MLFTYLLIFPSLFIGTWAHLLSGIGKPPKDFGTEYNRLISRRIFPAAVDAFRTYRMDFEDRNSELLKMTIETSPNSSDYEVSCGLVLQELEIIISPRAQWLTYIIKFITWSEEQVLKCSHFFLNSYCILNSSLFANDSSNGSMQY